MQEQQFPEGTPVYDANGEKVGAVSEHGVQGNALVIHHGLWRDDVYVPLGDVGGSDANGVRLNVSKDDLQRYRRTRHQAVRRLPALMLARPVLRAGLWAKPPGAGSSHFSSSSGYGSQAGRLRRLAALVLVVTSIQRGTRMSSSYTGILPGSRVRTQEGFIGTVEGLEHAGKDDGIQPDTMLVRSEDGHWR